VWPALLPLNQLRRTCPRDGEGLVEPLITDHRTVGVTPLRKRDLGGAENQVPTDLGEKFDIKLRGIWLPCLTPFPAWSAAARNYFAR
jgi:hypothetical protein